MLTNIDACMERFFRTEKQIRTCPCHCTVRSFSSYIGSRWWKNWNWKTLYSIYHRNHVKPPSTRAKLYKISEAFSLVRHCLANLALPVQRPLEPVRVCL